MAREIFALGSSRLIRAKAPIDISVEPNNPLDNTTDSATCLFRVFDPGKDEILTAEHALGVSVFNITDPGVYAIGDTVLIVLDNDSFDILTISAVTPAAGTITTTVGLTSAAGSGNRVRRIFGVPVNMAEYGAPDLDTDDWGFSGTLVADHVSQILDQDIDVEILFTGDGTSTKDAQRTICAVFKDVSDCG